MRLLLATILAFSLLIINVITFETPLNKNYILTGPPQLSAVIDTAAQSILIYQEGKPQPIVTQIAKSDFRPFLHPIAAPDGKGVLTEYSPGHHKHQTGIYWGFTRVNGRDYFHHPEGEYWQRESYSVIQSEGEEVSWQTVYNMLGEKGDVIMTEIQTWTFSIKEGRYAMDLEWQGKAVTDITIGKYDYGGLFVRMPWKQGVAGEIINAARQKNLAAEGQPAMWIDAGMAIDGRDDYAHIAIFDHPENKRYPHTWRVDSQMGFGPAGALKNDWQITKGMTEVIKHRLLIYTGERNDLTLTNLWEEYTGNNSIYATAALWTAAQEEGKKAAFLTPEEAVAGMTLQEGYQANVWASEPMMTQPMAFCWDDRGRLWVAENRDYESRGRGFSNDGNSRILILEDTDGDGVADSRKVFMEGIAFPAAIAVGFDGLYLGAPPHLLFVPDKNKDDKADMNDIQVLLTGWGIRDRHETINSLHWGPDGWLYGLQGFATPSKIRKPLGNTKIYGHKDEFPEGLLEGEGVDINGGVWRYHPTKDRFEVVAHGFSNPWGIDYDAKGQLFITACVIPHLWHIVPGGYYHRQGGQHFNPHVYSDIRTIADHSHRSAHGGARIYQSDAFPEEQKGRIFMANIHEHAVLSDVLVHKGSGFQGKHGDDFMMANNAQWVGFSMEVGPDGSLYVLDWHDADICGQEVMNKETGRIFRISAKNSLAENWKGRYADLSKFSDKELVDLQLSTSDWHSRRARVILQHRASQGKLKKATIPQLKKIFTENTNDDYRLRAFWALHLVNGLTGEELVKALDHKDAYTRAWAIQFLCEDETPSSKIAQKFIVMAENDPSAVVRLYLASQLSRIDQATQWEIISKLSQHPEDIDDHNLPKMIWFGLEPLVQSNPEKALELALNSKIPLLSNYVARRCVDGQLFQPLLHALAKTSIRQENLMEGFRDGLEGQSDISLPASWEQLSSDLIKKGGSLARITQEISREMGDQKVIQDALNNINNTNASKADRQESIRVLATNQHPELLRQLPTLIKQPDLRKESIKAISHFQNEPLGKLILEQYANLKADEKEEAIITLSSRPVYGRILMGAIADKTIPKRDVPVYVARQLMRVVGTGFVEVWGPIEQQSTSLETEYTRYRKLLSPTALKKGDIAKGKEVFEQTCGSCHKMYGKGGEIGPELTGSNRSHLDYLLFNILDPSGDIQGDYKLVVLTSRDGRTYTGNIVSETDRQIRLKTVGEGIISLNKANIQSKEVTEVSIMPPGLLDNLSEQEIINMIAYLQKMEPDTK